MFNKHMRKDKLLETSWVKAAAAVVPAGTWNNISVVAPESLNPTQRVANIIFLPANPRNLKQNILLNCTW